jgi:hypothetical protein
VPYALVSLSLQKDVSTNLNRLFCEVTSAGHRTYTRCFVAHKAASIKPTAHTSVNVINGLGPKQIRGR